MRCGVWEEESSAASRFPAWEAERMGRPLTNMKEGRVGLAERPITFEMFTRYRRGDVK